MNFVFHQLQEMILKKKNIKGSLFYDYKQFNLLHNERI